MAALPRVAFFPLLLLGLFACGDDTSAAGGGGPGGEGGGSTSTATVTSTGPSTSTDATAVTSVTSGDGGASAVGTGGGGDGGASAQGTGGAGGGATASLDVAWSILVGPSVVDCFYLGGETIEVVYERAGAPSVTERYTCLDGAGSSAQLPLGDYTVSATMLDYLDEVVLAAAPVALTVGAGGAAVDLSFEAPGARVSATWSIVNGAQPATCADAGASVTEIGLYDPATGRGYGVSVDCDLGEEVSGWVPLATYDVSLNLLDFDVVLFSSEPQVVALDTADATEPLDEVVFDLGAGG